MSFLRAHHFCDEIIIVKLLLVIIIILIISVVSKCFNTSCPWGWSL